MREHGEDEHRQQYCHHRRHLSVLLYRHVIGPLRARPRGHVRHLQFVVIAVGKRRSGVGLLEEPQDVQVYDDENHDADFHDNDQSEERFEIVEVDHNAAGNGQAPYDADADDGASGGQNARPQHGQRDNYEALGGHEKQG